MRAYVSEVRREMLTKLNGVASELQQVPADVVVCVFFFSRQFWCVVGTDSTASEHIEERPKCDWATGKGHVQVRPLALFQEVARVHRILSRQARGGFERCSGRHSIRASRRNGVASFILVRCSIDSTPIPLISLGGYTGFEHYTPKPSSSANVSSRPSVVAIICSWNMPMLRCVHCRITAFFA